MPILRAGLCRSRPFRHRAGMVNATRRYGGRRVKKRIGRQKEKNVGEPLSPGAASGAGGTAKRSASGKAPAPRRPPPGRSAAPKWLRGPTGRNNKNRPCRLLQLLHGRRDLRFFLLDIDSQIGMIKSE